MVVRQVEVIEEPIIKFGLVEFEVEAANKPVEGFANTAEAVTDNFAEVVANNFAEMVADKLATDTVEGVADTVDEEVEVVADNEVVMAGWLESER